jgi:ABC-2 type transport system ATP-binding protein
MNQPREAVIEIKGLVKKYKEPGGAEKVAVNGVDLSIYRGEIFALLGPNGAGKTTTVEILEGYRHRDAGEVSVLGKDPGSLGAHEREWRNKIGIVLQSTKDGQDLNVGEIISHFAKMYDNPRNVDEVIEAVGLREKVNSRLENLSGGQRRRVDVALGIIGNPELIFLDEPTTGFDPEARREFWKLIETLKGEGRTFLLTTHYLDEAEALSDRVGVIAGGKIIEIATAKTLGGRNTANAHVLWNENGQTHREETENPTAFVQQLASRFHGEIPELQVLRPSLEEIYIEMIKGIEAEAIAPTTSDSRSNARSKTRLKKKGGK